jgi:hypothetical protein
MIYDVFDLFANAIFSRNIPALERRAASWRFEPGFEVSVRTQKNQPTELRRPDVMEVG